MSEATEHECIDFTTQDFDSREFVCIKCGKVVDQQIDYGLRTSSLDGRQASAQDHNAGNELLLSATPQMDYVSKSNTGVAFGLNNPRVKDCDKKGVKKQLQDPYTVGNVCGKAMIVKEDPLTGERKLCFSKYEEPILITLKKRAMQEVGRWQFNTVEQTIIAKELKRMTSNLIMSDMVEYIWRAAILRCQLLDGKEAQKLNAELVQWIDSIRLKLITSCDSNQVKQIKENEARKLAKPMQIAVFPTGR